MSEFQLWRAFFDYEQFAEGDSHHFSWGSIQKATIADLLDALIEEGAEIVESERARCGHGLIGAHHIAHYGCDGNDCDQQCPGGFASLLR